MTTFASDGTPKTAPLEPAPVVEDPTPSAPQPDPTPAPQAHGEVAVQTATDVAVADQWEHGSDWPHHWLEFEGDRLGIRIPTQQAMSALGMGLGKFVPNAMKNDITSLFISKHLSPDSYERVYFRLMDSDDPNYTPDSIGELVNAILNIGVDQLEKASAEVDTKAKG